MELVLERNFPRFHPKKQYQIVMHQKHLFLKQIRSVHMSSIEKTAYPRFPKRKKIKQDELNHSYSLRQDEVNIIKRGAKQGLFMTRNLSLRLCH